MDDIVYRLLLHQTPHKMRLDSIMVRSIDNEKENAGQLRDAGSFRRRCGYSDGNFGQGTWGGNRRLYRRAAASDRPAAAAGAALSVLKLAAAFHRRRRA